MNNEAAEALMNNEAAEALRAEGLEPVESLDLKVGDHPRSSEQDLSEIKEIQRDIEAEGVLPELTASLDGLRLRIHGQRDDVTAEAVQAFAEVPEASAVRTQTAQGVRSAWKAYEHEVAQDESARNVEDVYGAREFKAAAAERRAASIGVSEVLLHERTDAILARFPKSVLPPPSQELAAQAQLIFARFPVATAESFFHEARGVLERASDPTTGLEEQVTANQLLETTYLPLCQRRADAPERHAKALQPAAAMLAALISTHLDSVLEYAHHRLAVGAVKQARGDFKWLTNQARNTGEWDHMILATGAQAFDFGDGK